MNEQVFRYGETGQGFGISCLPDEMDGAPVVVFLNAGLLHRAEPYRLNVLVSRALANLGYICIRVDLAGKGDSPERPETINRESVAIDWSFISKSIEKQFGERKVLILGLCSGADNAIKLTAEDSNIRGLVLLDPISAKDTNFKRRQLLLKLSNIHTWRRQFRKLIAIGSLLTGRKKSSDKAFYLRDAPTEADVKSCFEAVIERNGRVLAVFTSLALPYYNDSGQFVRSLDLNGLDRCCTEIFWPQMGHLFPVQHHRDLLVKTITKWAAENLHHFR